MRPHGDQQSATLMRASRTPRAPVSLRVKLPQASPVCCRQGLAVST